ncbi:unnamed protein product [Cochlearia groenlandica]
MVMSKRSDASIISSKDGGDKVLSIKKESSDNVLSIKKESSDNVLSIKEEDNTNVFSIKEKSNHNVLSVKEENSLNVLSIKEERDRFKKEKQRTSGVSVGPIYKKKLKLVKQSHRKRGGEPRRQKRQLSS